MALTHELADGVLRFTTTGDVEYRDGLSVLTEGLASAAATPLAGGWHLLFDIRHSTEDRSPDELRGIAAIITAHRTSLSGNCAVVASDPLHYGLARMFGVFMEGLGFNASVFDTTEDTVAWFATCGS